MASKTPKRKNLSPKIAKIAPTPVAAMPTGKELVEEAAVRAAECFAKFETCVALLNSAAEAKFYEAYDKAQLDDLKKLVAAAGHNIPAFGDAIKILLGDHAKAEKVRPTLNCPVPQVSMAQIFTTVPSAEDIKDAAENLAFATALVADTDIKGHQAEQMVRCLTFMVELSKNVKALGQGQAAA